jgi:hypothetical protein
MTGDGVNDVLMSALYVPWAVGVPRFAPLDPLDLRLRLKAF